MPYALTLSNGMRVPKPIAKRMAATDLVATGEMITASIKLDAMNAIVHKGYSTGLSGAQSKGLATPTIHVFRFTHHRA